MSAEEDALVLQGWASRMGSAVRAGHVTDRGERLAFGDLAVGERFIVFPTGGDDDGHGGFRGAMRVFTKVAPLRDHGGTSNSVREGDGAGSWMPATIKVIRLCPPVSP